jgi:hypothetical protein
MAQAASCWPPTVEPGFDDRPVQVNLWWMKVALEQVPRRIFGFPLPTSSHPCSTLIFLNTTLKPLLPEQVGKAWESPNKACSFGYRGILDRKILTHCFSLQRVEMGNNQTRSEHILH